MNQAKVRIAVDGMGGDYAPTEIVKGVAESARQYPDVSLIVTGPEKVIRAELEQYPASDNISVVDAPEQIEMGEEPGRAVRGKKKSSIVVGTGLVREGQADAFLSAGNTGAAMASALLDFGRIEGIKRPAIAVMLTTRKGKVLLLDAGANADSKPEYLPQFAVMGSIYSRDLLGVPNPKVGLLNIGEEAEKGSVFTKEAYKLLEDSPVDFAGNVEGKELFEGNVDVVVTDGFTGNVVLKIVEGVGNLLFGMLKDGIMSSGRAKAGGFLLAPALMAMRQDVDPEETGGAVLLGLNKVCIIAHGNSSAKAVRNAVRVAIKAVESDMIEHTRQGMK